MSLRSYTRGAAVLAGALSVLFAKEAFAQEKDGVRFRGGVALEGGVLAVPDIVTLGTAGISAQLGVQINNQFGVYVVPTLGALFNSNLGGVNVAGALMVDYTMLDNLITVGVGPDVGSFAAIGGSISQNGVSQSAAAGEFYGARFHFSVNPAVSIGSNGIRRKALMIGLDLRLLGGYGGFARQEATTSGSVSQNVAVGSFVVSPQFSIGYQAF
ncbi:MAG: hypothetical protein IPK82_03200 [Polyangiaceae bacterium]|nr:hypothetical protein [Polyangiaceae bacterium]